MISKEEIQNLAELARLKLNEEDVTGLQRDISNILEYVGQVSAESEGEKAQMPLHHNIMRIDTVRADEDLLAGKEEALRKAFPKEENGYNVVRKIIQK